MTILLIILALFIVAQFVAILILARRTSSSDPGVASLESKTDASFKLMLSQLNNLSRVVDSKMGETAKELRESMHHQFRESRELMSDVTKESGKLIRSVTEELVKVQEMGREVVSFADQLQSLQDILKNPKQRGVLGEYFLETVLRNVLPPGGYAMQYAFSGGEVVDAVVFVKDKIIPIDSKFSLENYNRLVEERNPQERERLEKQFVNDLKVRITETAKYIRPEEGTVDFAFMFIPSEGIYYDLLVNKVGAITEDTDSLIQRAASKHRVIIVSPTSFLAYLQTVIQGLKYMQIEESAKTIKVNVEKLGKHLHSYEEYHSKLGNALGTVVNHYNASGKEFKKVDKDIMRITGETLDLEIPVLDKPVDE